MSFIGSKNAPSKGKSIFVTVGTTRFDKLVVAVTSPLALDWMTSQGYTSLTVQYGTGIDPHDKKASSSPLTIQTYSFQPSLEEDMKNADLVISHAGAGTVMEALRLRKKLVVVINTALMDNHQTELAIAMAERGHLFMVENPELMEKNPTWISFQDFIPVPHHGGEEQDFSRLLDSYLGFSNSKSD